MSIVGKYANFKLLIVEKYAIFHFLIVEIYAIIYQKTGNAMVYKLF